MTNHAVVIAGGGPTGLMLAAELALAKVDVAIVERRVTQELAGSRALGLNPRSVELFDQRGVADRFTSKGKPYHIAMFATRLDITDLPSRHNYTLGLVQAKVETIMAEWAAALGVVTYRGVEVAGFTQDDSGVGIELSDDRTLRAQFLVGCDGGRSLVRKQAAIELVGWEPSTTYLIAECRLTDPALGFRYDARGTHAIGPREGGGYGLVLEDPTRFTREPTVDDLRAGLFERYGTDFDLRDVTWLSNFTDAARQATSYRNGRVLIAGDAAHIHSPVGGQGLNLGLQDAVNLGWKLAQVVHGTSSATLLDTYEAEMHPVGASVIRLTLAQTALKRTDERSKALQEVMAGLFTLDEPRKRYGAMMSGLSVRHDFGEGHPLLGRRMPDLDLGTTRVFELLRAARPVLINFGAPIASRIPQVSASYAGAWELPGIGAVPAPSALLVRPDGHVAWVGEASDRGLADAIARWF